MIGKPDKTDDVLIELYAYLSGVSINPAKDNEVDDIIKNWNIEDRLYEPSPEFIQRLSEYELWCKTKQGEKPGDLMEELAFLAFSSLNGWDERKSYQSFSSQHDLIISGSSLLWVILFHFLDLSSAGKTIVVEAKNLDSTVNDQQFSRLCYIIDNKFKTTCSLGVFFTRKGASGFDKYRVSENAHATQALFHARTNKFVIVFDHDDLLKLKERGSLPKLLREKIRNVEESSKMPDVTDTDGETKEILPSHLLKYVD
ncbi:MAG: hypothetical protein GY803_02935 [Chloroflexi bacterium]|nr:hypothetical protein [Chloroflexota bacterium]